MVAAGLFAPSPPRPANQHGAFAFPDSEGKRLLVVSEPAQPALFHTALCDGGRRSAVEFSHHQPTREGNNGRQWAGNFDQLSGDVFNVRSAVAVTGGVCFLVGDAFLSAAATLAVESQPGPIECDASMSARAGASRGRDVAHCWQVSRLPGERSLLLVQFARQGTDALGSLVLADRTRMIFADWPAKDDGAGKDVWRVGDGGRLDPSDFTVPFLLQQGDSYSLAVEWAREEGVSLSLFVSNGEDRFTKVVADYWYRAPL